MRELFERQMLCLDPSHSLYSGQNPWDVPCPLVPMEQSVWKVNLPPPKPARALRELLILALNCVPLVSWPEPYFIMTKE